MPKQDRIETGAWASVALPDWSRWGVDGQLLVPRCCLAPGPSDAWQSVDWLLAIFLMLEGWDERRYEARNGPIHSYSFRLGQSDTRPWEHAWVNRIGLFLREWAAHHTGQDENQLFGPIPPAQVILTHDLDAIRKTGAIRLKQAGFNAFNALRSATRGAWRKSGAHAWSAARFLFSGDNYDHLQEALDLERQHGLRSIIHIYSAAGNRTSLRSALFDPGYDLEQTPETCATLVAAVEDGHTIGLHPAFSSWQDATRMSQQRTGVRKSVPNAEVSHCRQHWLRFSWEQTWSAQTRAGLRHDATLGFNDRPGLRTSAALSWHPWNEATSRAHDILATPLMLMDSQLYDYGGHDRGARERMIDQWLGEVQAVGGTATVLWHPHTLGSDYGWKDGFLYLLDKLANKP